MVCYERNGPTCCISLGLRIMSQNPKARTASASNAVGHVSLFGPPPILPGEDAATYDALLAQVSTGVKPSDAIEKIWVRDVMDSSWEIFRLRRVKTSLIAKSIPSALRTTLAPLAHADDDSEWMDVLIKKWVAQKPSAIKQVNRLLASAKLTFDTVIARAVMANIDDIERIDRCITIAEGRRDRILREIDRRRAAFAQALRDKMQDVEDAEFETIEPKVIVSTGTAKSAA